MIIMKNVNNVFFLAVLCLSLIFAYLVMALKEEWAERPFVALVTMSSYLIVTKMIKLIRSRKK